MILTIEIKHIFDLRLRKNRYRMNALCVFFYQFVIHHHNSHHQQYHDFEEIKANFKSFYFFVLALSL